MSAMHFLHKKTLMLPLALIGGAVFYQWMGYITFLSPYLIFLMLFITYCKVSLRDLRLGRFEWILLAIQMVMAAGVYFSFLWLDRVVAQGLFICVFVPTATAAPVITSMLGGSISRVATYSLLCNLTVAAVGPLVLSWAGDHPDMTFMQSFMMILRQVAPLLLLPLVTALLLRYAFPKLHGKIVGMQQLSFYMWAVALFIIVGSCVSFTIKAWSPENSLTMIWLAFGALGTCLLQFVVGRKYGRRFGDPVAGGQGLMQKNTVLAVWLVLAYMNPIASVAPAAYIAWQNIINSWQLMRQDSKIDSKDDSKFKE